MSALCSQCGGLKMYKLDREMLVEGETRTYRHSEGVSTLILLAGVVDGLVLQRGKVLDVGSEVEVTALEDAMLTVMRRT